MTLLSALDDLLANTLSAVPGLLHRLRYLAGLRDENGAYKHWGLEKVHGSLTAQVALAEAHSLIFLEVLRTPVSRIRAEVSTEELSLVGHHEGGQAQELMPDDLRGGSRRHFRSVLVALDALVRSERNRPAA